MKLCEAPIDVLRGAIKTYQKTEHGPTGKMNADALIAYMKANPKAKAMIPKSYRADKQADIPLSIVRRSILAYRRKYHPAPSRMRRAELEAYMTRVKIRPVGKELQKLKRDKCEEPGLDMDRLMALADSDTDEEVVSAPTPVKRKRGRPHKVRQSTAGQKIEGRMLRNLAGRAAEMDEDTSLAW
jgi:hypothetical protein